MSNLSLAHRTDRGILRLRGEDVNSFLQGLISVDIEKCTPDTALYGALLTPQGKFLHDFFLVREQDGAVLLETEADRLDGLKKKLTLYKLRAKVTLEVVSDDFQVMMLFGDEALSSLSLENRPGAQQTLENGIIYVDPRLTALGARLLLKVGSDAPVEAETGDYKAHRLALGVPEGAEDLPVEKAILLENGFDELNGVDWKKGCYMGQELTARTKYRGLIRKRLMPFLLSESVDIAPGTPIRSGEKNVGEIRSIHGKAGLAMVRLDALEAQAPFLVDSVPVTITPPDWLKTGDD